MNTKRRNLQNGSYLTIAAIAIIPLFWIIGLAIDAGTLYVNRLRIQRACDAAAVAGTHLVNAGGVSNWEQVGKDVALAHAQASLKAISNSQIPVTFTINWKNSSKTIMDVEAQTSITLSFLPLIPGISKLQQIITHGTASSLNMQDPIAVSIIIDSTGSMGQDVTYGSVTKEKIAYARDAVDHFLDRIVPGQDYVSLVKFQKGDATLLNDFVTSKVDIDSVKAIVNNAGIIKAEGVSNHEKALLTSAQSFVNLSSSVKSTHKLIAIIISDGAPNTDCGTLIDDLRTKTNSVMIPLKYRDPSACTTNSNGIWIRDINGQDSDEDDYDKGYRERLIRPYDNALVAADYLRTLGVKVIAIGTGTSVNAYTLKPTYDDQGGADPESNSSIPGWGDPYQNIVDAYSRKDIYLRRMALESNSDMDPNCDNTSTTCLAETEETLYDTLELSPVWRWDFYFGELRAKGFRFGEKISGNMVVITPPLVYAPQGYEDFTIPKLKDASLSWPRGIYKPIPRYDVLDAVLQTIPLGNGKLQPRLIK